MATAPTPALLPSALTTLDAVKQWLFGADPTVQPAAATPTLIYLINAASRAFLEGTSRTFLVHQVNERRKGVGGDTLTLKEYPVLSINSVQVGNVSIPAGNAGGGSGYWLNELADVANSGANQSITNMSGVFARGSIIQLSYVAGYGIIDEAQTIPAANDYTIFPLGPFGAFALNYQVKLASTGQLMTPVVANPASGQYIPPTSRTTGYVFAAADALKGVLLSYSFTPSEVDYAVCKWVGEMYSYKGRIGQTTKSLGGQETAGYRIELMPQDVQMLCNEYSAQVPIV